MKKIFVTIGWAVSQAALLGFVGIAGAADNTPRRTAAGSSSMRSLLLDEQ